MAYVPTRADATPMAADMATRLSSALGATIPTNDRIVALCDDILCATGYQAQSDAAGLGTATTASTAFADVGNGSSTGFQTWSFTAPIAKTYLLRVDLDAFVTVAIGRVSFQVAVDGTAPGGQPSNAASFFFNQTAVHARLSFVVPIALSAGAHTIKLQWKSDGSATANVNTDSFRCFTMTG